MIRFIELTLATGHAVLLNAGLIRFVTPMIPEGQERTGCKTAISFGGDDAIYVTETANEILALIEP